MARDKVLHTRRLRKPIRLQDGRAVEDVVAAAIAGDSILPLSERVEVLERTFSLFEGGLQMFTADVELRAGGTGGRVVVPIEVDPSFVGQPVIITEQPGDRFEEMELGIVLFVGRVVDERTLEVAWFASDGAPARTRIAYILGATGRL